MADNEDRNTPPDITIKASTVPISAKAYGAALSQTYSFAPEWFEDALREAKTSNDHNARRREIVFAISCAENYLVEWVRDDVLDRDFTKLTQYFPPGQKKGAKDKWKDVLKQLKCHGVVPAIPDFSHKYWRDFVNLAEMRDGLVHASSSRPETSPQPEDMPIPYPSKDFLYQLPAGEATEVVVELVKQLHEAVQTDKPHWLVMP